METIRQTLSDLHLGDVSIHQNMAVMPLLSGHEKIPTYLTLDEALSKKYVHIKELSEDGVVPQLLLTNKGDKPVLLLDGEELLGAKQNRLINLTILAAARQSTIIPVSCVEAGRWHHSSDHFRTSKSVSFHKVRAEKASQVSASLRRDRSHRSNQAKVWDSIDQKACFMQAASPTNAMSEIFDRYDDSVDKFCEAFHVTENQVGAVFAINGEIMGFEFFDASSTLKKVFPKIIQSYALDAIEKQSHHSRRDDHTNTIEKEKAKEICDNLHVRGLAERNDSSPDVKPYIQETKTEWITVDLSPDMKVIQRYLKLALDQRYTELRRNGLRLSDNKSLSQLLNSRQFVLKQNIRSAKPLFTAIRITYALNIFEAHGITPFLKFCERTSKKKGAGIKELFEIDPNFTRAIQLSKIAQ